MAAEPTPLTLDQLVAATTLRIEAIDAELRQHPLFHERERLLAAIAAMTGTAAEAPAVTPLPPAPLRAVPPPEAPAVPPPVEPPAPQPPAAVEAPPAPEPEVPEPAPAPEPEPPVEEPPPPAPPVEQPEPEAEKIEVPVQPKVKVTSELLALIPDPAEPNYDSMKPTDAANARRTYKADLESAMRSRKLVLWGRTKDWWGQPEASVALSIPKHWLAANVPGLVERGLFERKGGQRGPGVKYRAVQPEADASPATPAPAAEAPESESVRRMRDWVRQQTPGEVFNVRKASEGSRLPRATALGCLDALSRKGVLSDESPSDDLRLFSYVKPTDMGDAARKDANRRAEAARESTLPPTGAVRSSSAPVPGTGSKMKASHPEVQRLIDACYTAGAVVRRAANGHFEISNGKKRVLISSTPRSAKSVLTDRARVRRELALTV